MGVSAETAGDGGIGRHVPAVIAGAVEIMVRDFGESAVVGEEVALGPVENEGVLHADDMIGGPKGILALFGIADLVGNVLENGKGDVGRSRAGFAAKGEMVRGDGIFGSGGGGGGRAGAEEEAGAIAAVCS